MRVQELVSNYLTNRRDFYATLLARVPHPALRSRLSKVERTGEGLQADSEACSTPDCEVEESLLPALALLDLLKRPSQGQQLGRTAVSIEEALMRTERVEETGLLLFEELARMMPVSADAFRRSAARHRAALTAVLQLSDDLRYHRLTL